MSHKHKTVIQKIYAHPVATNLDWKKLQATLEHYGVTVEQTNANKARLAMAEQEIWISLPHHGHELNEKSEVIKLRHFLELVEITPQTA